MAANNPFHSQERVNFPAFSPSVFTTIKTPSSSEVSHYWGLCQVSAIQTSQPCLSGWLRLAGPGWLAGWCTCMTVKYIVCLCRCPQGSDGKSFGWTIDEIARLVCMFVVCVGVGGWVDGWCECYGVSMLSACVNGRGLHYVRNSLCMYI